MLGGLIAGALKGAGEGYATYAKGEMETQQKLDYATKILELQEQKDLRIDEIRRSRDFADKKRDIEEIDPLRIQSKVSETKAVGAAQTGVEVAREGELGPVKTANAVAQERAVGPVRAENEGLAAGARVKAEGQALTDLGKNKDYISALQTISTAKEGSAAKTQAAAVMFELGQKKSIFDLRNQLSKLPVGDPKREELTQQITDLSGASIKSASDVISAATNWRMMAKDLRKDAENANSDEERNAIREQARQYEILADSIQRTVINQRVPGANVPKTGGPAGGKPAAPAAPWERNWSSPGNVSNNPAP